MMTSMPLVSILISSYNQKEFLRPAIESALAQDYPKLEIIVSDDASIDGSVELIQAYKKQFPQKIKAIYSDLNEGQISNYNKLLAAATGKYVLRLDGDDILHPDNVAIQAKTLAAHPDWIGCYHNLELFDSDTDRQICLFIDAKRPPRRGNWNTVVKYGCFFPGAFSMLHRSRLPQEGFSTKARRVSDYLFMVEMLSKGGELGYIDQVLGRYRMHSHNLTANSKLLALHTLWAGALIAWRYPRHFFRVLFRFFDAARAVITRRNAWM